MKSPLPKVLHPVAGRPMVGRVVEAAKQAGAKEIRVVVGYGEMLVRQVVEPMGAVCLKQESQLGTADAVRSARAEEMEGTVVILNGDHPLITAKDIKNMVSRFRKGSAMLSVVTTELEDPGSYGRIVRHMDHVRAVVEAKDASADTLAIKEINTGIYVLDGEILKQFLPRIENNNVQGEYYFTDIISLAFDGGHVCAPIESPAHVAEGVNSQRQLAVATKKAFLRKAEALMDEGVIIVDPDHTYIEDNVFVGAGSVIYPGSYLRGTTRMDRFCVIESHCYLSDSELSEAVQVRAGSYLEQAVVKAKAIVGPYARLRPDTEVGVDARVGNFVELKKVKFGDGAKASHLTYLGDAEIGANTNIGCGTITCNYAADHKKYKTVIGKDVFVGSDTQFVAPLSVGDGAVIGSGSTITKDVPAGALAVARGRQVIKENYQPKKSNNDE